MSSTPRKSEEFRRYRQILTAIWLGTAGAAALLLATSVAHELLFRKPSTELPPSTLSAENPAAKDLLECQQDVLTLMTDLSVKTCELFAIPVAGERGELPSAWSEFTREWRERWYSVDAQCRFSELADTNLGVAYDRMAQVHSDLQTMRLKYQSLVVRFDDEQAAELARMRRALERSRAAFEERLEDVPTADVQPSPDGEPR